MTFLKTTLLAAAATLAVASVAQAADPIMPTPIIPVAPAPAAFDWNGFYAGIHVGAENQVDFDETNWLIGAELGVNTTFDMFVLGAELGVDYVFDGTPEEFAYLEGTVRAGVLLMPEALIYGTVGYGADLHDTAGSGEHVLAGLGAEFAVAESVTLDARYVYGWAQDAADTDIHKFTIGANFHF